MKDILKKITDRIAEDEAESFKKFSAADFKLVERPKPIDIMPVMEKDFFVIAEIKKGSPSKGIIRNNFDPLDIALSYEKAGASAISVLTEKNFFYGSKENLSLIKARVKIPLLRKDFIIHPFQVYESYNLGADFILLIAACLTDPMLQKLYSITLSLGMQALIEIHNEEELKRVLSLKPRLIGINNRDLNTFDVDISVSVRLKELIPAGIHVISESGILDAGDVILLKEKKFSGILVGETLLRKGDPEKALKGLLRGKD
jgi:indole-3-glycerol phosphate synthase